MLYWMTEKTHNPAETISTRKPEEIIDELGPNRAFDYLTQSREYRILGRLSPEHIQTLVMLPFEIALTEEDGVVILTTGNEREAAFGNTNEYAKRRDESRLSMHTHPNNLHCPSFTDILLTESAQTDTPLILATQKGIIRYQQPRQQTRSVSLLPWGTDEEDDSDNDRPVMKMILKFLEIKGLGIGTYSNNPSIATLSPNKQTDLAREFATQHQMIVVDVPWSDTSGISEMMEIINLHR
jgi:proteasome lid subunit RPN8/RPN11